MSVFFFVAGIGDTAPGLRFWCEIEEVLGVADGFVVEVAVAVFGLDYAPSPPSSPWIWMIPSPRTPSPLSLAALLPSPARPASLLLPVPLPRIAAKRN